jgi:glycosyltransferase involved in cell wall biosynthesis
MRVGMLTTSFPRDDSDIAGRFVLGFARALHAHGHEVEVLAPEPRTRTPPPRWPGVRVQHVPYLRPRALQRTFYGDGVPDNLRRDAAAWLGLAPFTCALIAAAHGRSRQWHALISHWALPCALAAGLVRRHQRHVAVLHSADVHLLTRVPGRRALARMIARSADALWFTHRAHETAFLSLLPNDATPPVRVVSPMGIDWPSPREHRAERRAQFRRQQRLERFTVLTLGRLIPIKGIDLAIRAAAAGGMTLLVAGDGPERRPLERLARALGADVRFLGTITGEAKRAFIEAADAFALPSRRMASGRSEGVPTALLEAMAHGLPLVAANVGGISDVLGSELANQLVTPDNPSALVATLHTLRECTTHARAVSEQGQKLARSYAWEQLGPRISALIEPLGAAGAPAR